MRRQGQGLRSDLHLRRSQSVRSLQRVPALNMSATVGAVTGLNIEAPHYRLPNDVLLKLLLCVVVNDLSTTVRTRLWQRNRNPFIDAIGNRPERAQSVI